MICHIVSTDDGARAVVLGFLRTPRGQWLVDAVGKLQANSVLLDFSLLVSTLSEVQKKDLVAILNGDQIGIVAGMIAKLDEPPLLAVHEALRPPEK